MYVIVKDKDEIGKCQRRLIDILTAGTYPIPCKPGVPKNKDGIGLHGMGQLTGAILSTAM